VERIRKRGLDSEEVIKARIPKIKEYLKPENDKKFDYVVVNKEGKLEETIGKAEKIIKNKLIDGEKI
jgi:guanylate kinase